MRVEESPGKLQRLFSMDLLRLGSSRSNSQSKESSLKKSKVLPMNTPSKVSEDQKSPLTNQRESLQERSGIWTNITVEDVLDWDEDSSICQTQCVRFVPNKNFPNLCPQVFGAMGKASKISTIREDCVFTKVEIF
jgi:hypothetical protein